MRENSQEIIVVMDRSGSMQAIAEGMCAGFDKFVREQKLIPGECRISLYRFDDQYEAVYERLLLDAVPPLKLEPRGNTALYDAVGRTIQSVGRRLADTPEAERPEKVLFLVITDGQENCSRTFTARQVREMIQHQQDKYNWAFVYLGSESSTWADAERIGVSSHSTYTYDSSPASARRMWENLSAANARYKGATGMMSWGASVGNTMPKHTTAEGSDPSNAGVWVNVPAPAPSPDNTGVDCVSPSDPAGSPDAGTSE